MVLLHRMTVENQNRWTHLLLIGLNWLCPWLYGVRESVHTKQLKTWKKTNIYIRERPCFRNLALGYVCVDFVLQRL